MIADAKFERCTHPYPCDYLDKDRAVLYRVARWPNASGKSYSYHRPNGPGEWLTGRGDVQRVPYRLPELRDAIARGEVVHITEGEKKVHLLVSLGICATCNDGGAGKWRTEHSTQMRGARSVVVWGDNDAPGRNHVKAIASAFHQIGVPEIRTPELPGLAEGEGLDDWLKRLASPEEARAQLDSIVANTTPFVLTSSETPPSTGVTASAAAAFEDLPEKPTRDEIISALRSVADTARNRDVLDSTAIRQEATEQLKARGVSTRDAADLVKAAFNVGAGKSSGMQGAGLDFQDPAPWPGLVSGEALLDEIVAKLREYVSLPEPSARAAALWVVLSYCLDHALVAPRLILTSPTRECGKTRLLTVLGALARRPLQFSSITAASLFRCIEKHSPTLLLDEFDNAKLKENDELRAVLNSGHTRGAAYAMRTVGDDHEPHRFSTWCLIAFAAIGALPDTLTSRSIVLELQRKTRTTTVRQLREPKLMAELDDVRRKLVRWARDNGPALAKADPALPTELVDRAADNWSVFVAIADAAGARWGRLARETAIAFAGKTDEASTAEMLLADVRDVFTSKDADRLSSEEIVNALGQLDGRPWPEYRAGNALSKSGLARLLKRFKDKHGAPIQPQQFRFSDGTNRKGYLLESLSEAFDLYLPPDPKQPKQASNGAAEIAFEFPKQSDPVSVAENASSPHGMGAVSSVSVPRGNGLGESFEAEYEQRIAELLGTGVAPDEAHVQALEETRRRFQPEPSAREHGGGPQ